MLQGDSNDQISLFCFVGKDDLLQRQKDNDYVSIIFIF